jgi:two-component system nitrogen regulation response regulator NtrX
VTEFADDALAALEAYPWPGNVRELQNIVERACALADGPTVRRQDLPDYLLHAEPLRVGGAAPTLGQTAQLGSVTGLPLQEARESWMRTLESAYLRDLLERHGGNISAAAKAARIDRKTFHRLVTKYQIR